MESISNQLIFLVHAVLQRHELYQIRASVIMWVYIWKYMCHTHSVAAVYSASSNLKSTFLRIFVTVAYSIIFFKCVRLMSNFL